MRDLFSENFFEAERLLMQFRADEQVLSSLVRSAEIIADCFRRRGRVFSCGNGGSMADAMHFAEEWSGRFKDDRVPYPAMALSDPTHMSCTANDYGFEHVFARQVSAFGHPGDVLLALSTSGSSVNIVRACEAAREREMTVIGFLGKGGGAVAPLCEVIVMPPGDTSDRIQELHMLALHALIDVVEKELGH